MIGSVFGALFLVIGLLIVWRSVRGCYLAVESSAWPSTSGTVIESEVEANSVIQSGVTYRPRVAYRYEVSGNEFDGDCLFFGDWVQLPVSFTARRYTERYRPGSQITVFYDPRKPWNAVIEPGFHGVILYGCTFGLFFTFIGILLLFQQT